MTEAPPRSRRTRTSGALASGPCPHCDSTPPNSSSPLARPTTTCPSSHTKRARGPPSCEPLTSIMSHVSVAGRVGPVAHHLYGLLTRHSYNLHVHVHVQGKRYAALALAPFVLSVLLTRALYTVLFFVFGAMVRGVTFIIMFTFLLHGVKQHESPHMCRESVSGGARGPRGVSGRLPLWR